MSVTRPSLWKRETAPAAFKRSISRMLCYMILHRVTVLKQLTALLADHKLIIPAGFMIAYTTLVNTRDESIAGLFFTVRGSIGILELLTFTNTFGF